MARTKTPRSRGNRETTGENLLDAAAAIMTEQDSVDVPLADIAERAGMNIALIKYYFGNKEGMMTALVVREAERIVREFRALVAMEGVEPVEKLRRHIAAQVMIYWRFPYFDGLLRNLLRDSSSESARLITREYISAVCDAQQTLLTAASAKGQIKAVDARNFYFATSGACHYLFSARATLKHVFGHDRISDDMARSYANDVARMIMEGLEC